MFELSSEHLFTNASVTLTDSHQISSILMHYSIPGWLPSSQMCQYMENICCLKLQSIVPPVSDYDTIFWNVSCGSREITNCMQKSAKLYSLSAFESRNKEEVITYSKSVVNWYSPAENKFWAQLALLRYLTTSTVCLLVTLDELSAYALSIAPSVITAQGGVNINPLRRLTPSSWVSSRSRSLFRLDAGGESSLPQLWLLIIASSHLPAHQISE